MGAREHNYGGMRKGRAGLVLVAFLLVVPASLLRAQDEEKVTVERVSTSSGLRLNITSYGGTALEAFDKVAGIMGMTVQTDEATRTRLGSTTLSVSLDQVALEAAVELIAGAVDCTAGFDGPSLVVQPFDSDLAGLEESSILAYRNAMLLFPKSDRVAKARFRMAQLLASRQDLGGAADEYVGFVKEYPQSEEAPLALLEAARILGRVGNRAGLRELTFKIIESYPRSSSVPDACVLTVASFLDDGELQAADRAVRLFKRRFGETRDLATAHWRLGKAYQDLGEHESAIQVFIALVRSRLLGSESLHRLAMQDLESRYAIGRLEEAATILARELKAGNPHLRQPAWQVLASEIYYDAKMPLFALMLTREILSGAPKPELRNRAAFVAARCYLDLGLPGRTRELLAVEMEDLTAPGRGRLALDCARLFRKQGRQKEAGEIYERLQVLPEFRAVARYGLAELRFLERDFEACLDLLGPLSAEEGELEAEARRLAADCYIALGRRRRAIEVLEGSMWGQG